MPGESETKARPADENRILIIAREEDGLLAVQQLLHAAGPSTIEAITDARKALPAFRHLQPDVVLMDGMLDHMDAISLMKQLSARVPADEFLPFVVLTAPSALALKRQAADSNLSAFFQDPEQAEEVALLTRELISVRRKGFRIASALQATAAEAKRVETEVARHMAHLADFKDHPNSGHTDRVGHLSALIALVLGMPGDQVEIMRLAAPLHDVGKIGIPDAILLKEEPLTLEEMDVVKTHTTVGASILAGSTTPLFQMAEEIALYHHENWDGTGYTPGLEGESIPLIGRIVRVVDAFDAITHSRPFAEQWRRDSAIEFIRSQSGHNFDPRVVEAFLEVQAEAEESEELARGLL